MLWDIRTGSPGNGMDTHASENWCPVGTDSLLSDDMNIFFLWGRQTHGCVSLFSSVSKTPQLHFPASFSDFVAM